MSPGLPAPVSSPAQISNIRPLTTRDIEQTAEKLSSRSRAYVLGDPYLCPDLRRATCIMRGLLKKLQKVAGEAEAARLIAEISFED